MVRSGDGEIYNRFEESLRTSLSSANSQNTLTVRDVAAYKSQQSSLSSRNFDAIITAGIDAAITVSQAKPDITLFMAIIPKDSYFRLRATDELHCPLKHCRVIFLDQPIARQLQFFKLVMPNAKVITILSSQLSSAEADTISQVAVNFGLRVNIITVNNEDAVLSSLKQNLNGTDVLMAIPDKVVYNRNTARAIILSTFYQHIPLYAYSQSFVRAGATFAIYSSPEDIGKQVAELLAGKINKPATQQWLYPRYYKIDVNQHAADALGIQIEDGDVLIKRLKQYDKE